MTTESQSTDASRDPIRDAFHAGYDAGWEHGTRPHSVERGNETYAAYAKVPDPNEVKRQVDDIINEFRARLRVTPRWDDDGREVPVEEVLATLAYELGARVR